MDEDTHEAYKTLGKGYLESIAESFPREMKEFIESLPKRGSVLDVGCAGGRDSAIFTEHGFSVLGIDITDEFLEEARKDVPGAEFRHMDVLDLDLPEDHFDVVWANAILLHIPKDEVGVALRNLFRVLKPGGKMHVRVKLGNGEKRIVDKLSGGKQRLFTFYAEGELDEHIQQVGFHIEQSRVIEDESGRAEVKWVSIQAIKPAV